MGRNYIGDTLFEWIRRSFIKCVEYEASSYFYCRFEKTGRSRGGAGELNYLNKGVAYK